MRDDGLLAGWLAPLGRRVLVTPLALLAVVPPLAVLAAAGRSHAWMAAAVVWMVVFGGASAGARPDRFDWLVAALLRAGEYALLLWIGLEAGFALLVALTLVHYDLAYRPRHLGAEPPTWWTGGWDGRLVVAWTLLVAGALPAGLYVLAGATASAFIAGSPVLRRRQGDAT